MWIPPCGSEKVLWEPWNVGRGGGGRCPRSVLLSSPQALGRRQDSPFLKETWALGPAWAWESGRGWESQPCFQPRRQLASLFLRGSAVLSRGLWIRYVQPTRCQAGAQTASRDHSSPLWAGERLGLGDGGQAPCPPKPFLPVWGLRGPAGSALRVEQVWRRADGNPGPQDAGPPGWLSSLGRAAGRSGARLAGPPAVLLFPVPSGLLRVECGHRQVRQRTQGRRDHAVRGRAEVG